MQVTCGPFPPLFQHVLWKTWKTRNFAGFSAFPSNSDSKADQQCQLEWRVLAMTVRIISILAVAIAMGPSLAYGSPTCMTQSEARAKFPNATHLYMREHCWSDSAVAPVHPSRQPSPAVMPASSPPPALAAAPAPSPRPEPEIVNSGIDAGAQCQYLPCE
jgi:hypothetical protein